MRPLELRLVHFGPYRDQAILNFEALDRLFLVYGPTGAGKTTLFDALTFALYEKTPGTRGTLTDQLVSHHAPEGSVPEVSLRFALGPQQWRVTRQLKHRVRKQRGDGWRDQEAQVLLEKQVEGGWEPVEGKRSEVNQRLEAMLGLSAEEFAKIVVLPQGDFQRFLEATSGERERMLQKLFPIEAYERLVDGLKAQARAAEEARRRWEDRWQDLSGRMGEGTGDRTALEEALAGAQAQAQSAAEAEAQASEVVVRLRSLWSDWRLLEEKRQRSAALEDRRPAVEADRRRRDRARLVRPLAGDLDRQDQVIAQGRSLRAAHDQARDLLTRTESAWDALEAQAPEAALREARLSALLQERGLLEHQKVRWTESRSLVEAEARAREAEQASARALERASALRLQAEAGLPPAPDGPGWEESLALVDRARADDAGAQTRARTEAQRQAWEAELLRCRSERDEASSRMQSAEGEVVLWTQVIGATKAADLASQLVPGQGCPVCGSVDHPQPARWPEASAQAPLRLAASRSDLDQARQAWAASDSRCTDLEQRLGDLPPSPPKASTPEETGPALATAQARIEALRAWTTAREAAAAALEAAKGTEAKALQAWQAATQTKEGWTHRIQALADSVPADPGPRLVALAREEATLRDRIEADRKQAEVLVSDRQTHRTRVEELGKQLEAQRREYTDLKSHLEASVASLGWSLDELVAARLAEPVLVALEASVEAFDQDLIRLAGETSALEAKFPSGPPAPLEEATAHWESLRVRRQEAEAQARDHEYRLRDRDRFEDEMRTLLKEKDGLEETFQKLVPLARALEGGNALNLRFTTWVLVQALEQVTRSASHRLAAMSGGRYALKVQSQGLDGRRTWGLDLAVTDGFTGQERPVGTLSGGEKFLTSISLALGLADVIQERSGGLKLEAIFIDEGFGTLDDQSLDGAMAILHDLGQHRSVGIISHVAELRQRISSRVEVVKGKDGSRLRVGTTAERV